MKEMQGNGAKMPKRRSRCQITLNYRSCEHFLGPEGSRKIFPCPYEHSYILIVSIALLSHLYLSELPGLIPDNSRFTLIGLIWLDFLTRVWLILPIEWLWKSGWH